jgi:hypothetical protein
MAMMAAGLERQLGRCNSSAVPNFCNDNGLHSKILRAYNHLWDVIESNVAHLSTEVWSWQFANGTFQFLDFGKVSPTGEFHLSTQVTLCFSIDLKLIFPYAEADIVQLWSLTFLSVKRNPNPR